MKNCFKVVHNIFSKYTFIFIIALSLSIYAYFKVKIVYAKYDKMQNLKKINGINVAKMLLNNCGLFNVPVEIAGGNLTDKYDLKNNTIKLTNSVYNSDSVTAMGIAAHQVGHAIQHSKGYSYLKIRDIIAYSSSIISNISLFIIILSWIFNLTILNNIGIIIFGVVVFIQLLTIHVEFDASKRALGAYIDTFSLEESEISKIKDVLYASALNYASTMVISIGMLMYVIGGRLTKIMMRVLR